MTLNFGKYLAMKTLREYIDIIDEAEQTEEGLRSAAAGAALAGAMALSQPAQAQEPPPAEEQIRAAIKDGDVPRGQNFQARGRGGWITSVTVDGKTYDLSHRLPATGNQMIAAADQIRGAMREQELEESEPEDPIQKINRLFRDK